jgi:hypothetical protein
MNPNCYIIYLEEFVICTFHLLRQTDRPWWTQPARDQPFFLPEDRLAVTGLQVMTHHQAVPGPQGL